MASDKDRELDSLRANIRPHRDALSEILQMVMQKFEAEQKKDQSR